MSLPATLLVPEVEKPAFSCYRIQMSKPEIYLRVVTADGSSTTPEPSQLHVMFFDQMKTSSVLLDHCCQEISLYLKSEDKTAAEIRKYICAVVGDSLRPVMVRDFCGMGYVYVKDPKEGEPLSLLYLNGLYRDQDPLIYGHRLPASMEKFGYIKKMEQIHPR